ncbi:MAG: TonB-dependent receptor [Tannerellaceae bacterium]|nr:TonB-dependent receptor [Tannerellaceae bacterium]
MKLILVVLLICISGLFAVNIDSQTARVNINAVNVEAKEIINQIEKQTDYLFVYNYEKVNLTEKKSVKAIDAPVAEVLTKMFEHTDVVYAMEGKNILLMKRNEPVGQQQNTRRITGVVVDQTTGEPIIGANVVVKGTTTGTITDLDGTFSLNISPDVNTTLVASYIGYVSREVRATSSSLQISLREDSQTLEEIVVVGYGSQRKVNLSGAVAQVDAKALESRPVQNISSALQGLISGVTVQSGQGRPGQDEATIRIRGVGTLNNASPYVLIDGIESGTLNSIDPNDVESISVLKDASSAAIYGSKASNGVILVTTKRGKTGDPRVSYNGYAGVQTPTQMIKRLSSYDYARLLNQALVEDGKPERFSADDIQKFRDGTDPAYPNTNWYDLAYKTGFQHQHNVNVSGGTEKASYMASAGYLQQEGILPNATRQQFNGRANLDVKISDRFKLRANMAYIKNDYKDPNSSYASGSSDQIIRQLNIIAPWIPNRTADGAYGTVSDGNPIAWLDLDQTVDRYNQNFAGLVAADYRLFDGLTVTLQGAFTNNVQRYKSQVKEIQYNPSKYHGPSSIDDRYYLWSRTNSDVLLNYDKQFGPHSVKALAGWHTEKYNYNENVMNRKNFPNNDLTDLNAGTASTQTNTGYSRELSMLSAFGRINYDYAGRYLAEANFRADASSRFAPGKRWGYFPSFSAAWRISEEAFVKDADAGWLNNLKIRASWGLLGNQDALNSSNANDYYPYLNTYDLDASYPFGGTLYSGYYQKTFRIETITWEKARTVGIGADFAVFNHIDASIDYYNRKTTGIIMEIPTPAEFAIGDNYRDNVGKVQNSGLEISAGYTNKWGDWSLGARGNFSYNKNEILSLGDVERIIDGNSVNYAGHGIASFYVYKADGFFQSQEEADAFMAKYNSETGTTMFTRPFKAGDIKYVDVNGDGKIDGDDRIVTNSTNPAFMFGLNLTGGYRNFDLSLIFSGAAKAARIFGQEAFGAFRGDASHPASIWLDAWTPENKNAKMPRIWNDVNSNSYPQNVMSTFWVQNTSYLRLKNLQVGYTFSPKLIKAAGLTGLRLYYSAENLFTLDSMLISLDPETSSERASSYPLIKTHSFGVNLTF